MDSSMRSKDHRRSNHVCDRHRSKYTSNLYDLSSPSSSLSTPRHHVQRGCKTVDYIMNYKTTHLNKFLYLGCWMYGIKTDFDKYSSPISERFKDTFFELEDHINRVRTERTGSWVRNPYQGLLSQFKSPNFSVILLSMFVESIFIFTAGRTY